MRTSDPSAQPRVLEAHWQRLVAMPAPARAAALLALRAEDALLAARLAKRLARLDAQRAVFGEPLDLPLATAREDGRARRRRWHARSWRRLAIAALVLLAVGVAAERSVRLREARREADAQRAVSDFAFDLLQGRDDAIARLRDGARRAPAMLAESPAARRDVLARLAQALLDAGAPRDALPLASQALAAAGVDARAADDARLSAFTTRTRALLALGRLDAARWAARESVAAYAARFGADDAATARAALDEAIVLHARGDFAEASAAFVALDAAARAAGRDRRALRLAWANLARDAGDPETALALRRDDAAEPSARDAAFADARGARAWPDDAAAVTSAADARYDEARDLLALGRLDEASALLARAGPTRAGADDGWFPSADHAPTSARASHDRSSSIAARPLQAALALARGRARTARRLLAAAIADSERAIGAAHPDTARLRIDLGDALLALGDAAGAREAYDDATGVLAAIGEHGHPSRAAALAGRAAARWRLGDARGAAIDLREAIACRERDFGITHPDTLVLVEARDALRGVAVMPRVAATQDGWREVARVRRAFGIASR